MILHRGAFNVLLTIHAALKYVSRHNFGPRPDSLTNRDGLSFIDLCAIAGSALFPVIALVLCTRSESCIIYTSNTAAVLTPLSAVKTPKLRVTNVG